MDEVTINKIIQTEPISKYFIGVFARNEVPRKILLYPSCFIFNTQSRDNEGEHWLADFINKRKKCYFLIHMVFLLNIIIFQHLLIQFQTHSIGI